MEDTDVSFVSAFCYLLSIQIYTATDATDVLSIYIYIYYFGFDFDFDFAFAFDFVFGSFSPYQYIQLRRIQITDTCHWHICWRDNITEEKLNTFDNINNTNFFQCQCKRTKP